MSCSPNPNSVRMPYGPCGPNSVRMPCGKLWPGMRFWPTDKETVGIYLYNKACGRTLPFGEINQGVDVYGHNPDDLPLDISFELDTYGSEIWAYFFVPREPSSDHRTPTGYWEVTDDEEKVIGDEGRTIGFKKLLTFYRGNSPNGVQTPYIMDEYRLNPEEFHELKDSDVKLVVCKVCKGLSPPWRSEDFDDEFVVEEN